ncbi:LysR family transcriptional regulator [Alcaligenaceae bacterium]|nr:LysR family transcriptional regulator [Alcaligenaceae bacterium]
MTTSSPPFSDSFLLGLLSLKQIDYFHASTQHQSLRAAATQLGIPQSVLSRQVRALEEAVGLELLLRTRQGITLTDAGRQLQRHAARILDELRQTRLAVERFRDIPMGKVRLGIPATLSGFLLPPLFRLFSSDMHKTKLSIVEGSARHIEQWLRNGEVDVGIIVGPSRDPVIEAQCLYKEDLYLIHRATTAMAVGDEITFIQLADLPLVLPLPPVGSRQVLDQMAKEAGFQLAPMVEVDSPNSQKHLVLEHGLYGVFSRLVCRAELADGILRAIPIRPAPQRAFYIATRKGARLSQASRLLSPVLRRVAASLDHEAD